MKATISGMAVAPVSRSRVAPVRLAETSSVSWMYANRDFDDELGQHGDQGDDCEDEAAVEDRFPGVGGPSEQERRPDQPDPQADRRELHREERGSRDGRGPRRPRSRPRRGGGAATRRPIGEGVASWRALRGQRGSRSASSCRCSACALTVSR